MKQRFLYVAWAQAVVSSIGSIFLSEILHWAPCVLCWYQRSFMYPLAVILTVAIFKPIKELHYFVYPLAIIGGLIAVFHNLLQYRIIPEALAPCVNGVSCTIPYHFVYNFVTVPLLSLLGFIVVIIFIHLYRKDNSL